MSEWYLMIQAGADFPRVAASRLQLDRSMLPVRKSGVVPKKQSAVAAEVRAPSTGQSFVALAIGVRPDGLALNTFHMIPSGTPVEVMLTLPDGRAYVEGVIAEGPDGGLAIDLRDIDEAMHVRLQAAGARNAA